jgi:hypothetical protein
MSLAMNWFDWLFIILISITVWSQWDEGLLILLSKIGSWFLGLAAGFRFTTELTQSLWWYSGLQYLWLEAIVFFGIVIVVVLPIQQGLLKVFGKSEHQFLSGIWQWLAGGSLIVSYTALVLVFVIRVLLLLPVLTPFFEGLAESWFYLNVYEVLLRELS